jgi:hypothetical protein
LYSRRDDITDDTSDSDQRNEYNCVSEFASKLEAAHKNNFALAANIALLKKLPSAMIHITDDDYKDVMARLSFIPAAKILVVGDSGLAGGENSAKLMTLLRTVLLPILQDGSCLLYKGDPSGDYDQVPGAELDIWSVSDEIASVSTEHENVDDLSTAFESYNETTVFDDVSQKENSSTIHSAHHTDVVPIFVRLLLDDVYVSIHDLSRLKSSSILTVLVSIYKSEESANETAFEELPSSHRSVALQISNLVNAYMAEQTLERLRHLGSAMDENDFRIAKACMQKARYVERLSIDILLYDSKTDSMVFASASSGNDALIEEGFRFITEDISCNDTTPVRILTKGRFVVLETPIGKDELKYWCFIRVMDDRGIVVVEVYHPSGRTEAVSVMFKINELVTMACHRANQRLLLKRLHEVRNASILLVLPDDGIRTSSETNRTDGFYPGYFGCPVVFSTTFDLFHRCATNPQQVARALEGSVLHIFALSNRRHIFVYKDEDNSIFYISLAAEGGGVEADGVIHLLVYGIDCPGPSVTLQLTRLLKKRLLMIAVEMLSSVLTKNPKYVWRPADLTFVRSYRKHLIELDDPQASNTDSTVQYIFPAFVTVPGMLLLYFRQNLCGSTYFQPLLNQESATRSKILSRDVGAGVIEFDWANFTFYFNNAPSKLDPNFQAQSTLTEKGAEYSRNAGTGIAVIEVFVTDRTGREVRELNVVGPLIDVGYVANNNSTRFHRFEAATSLDAAEKSTSLLLHVKVTGTGVRTSTLHDWILLSLNQVLVSLTIEHQLMGWSKEDTNVNTKSTRYCASVDEKMTVIKTEICPSLPYLMEMLDVHRDLPHPAIRTVKDVGVVRSSEVASVAYELLEKTMFEGFRLEMKGRSLCDFMSDLIIIRLSRTEKPRRVLLDLDSTKRRVLVSLYLTGGTKGHEIRDAPVDCPEYLCYFARIGATDYNNPSKAFPPKLFEEVSVQDLIGDDARSMSHSFLFLKKENKVAFQRSFAFVYSIKRNQRTLFTYNWSTNLLRVTTARLAEKNRAFLLTTGQLANTLQRRSLLSLAPISAQRVTSKRQLTARKSLSVSASNTRLADTSINTNSDQLNSIQPLQPSDEQSTSMRRIPRPISIRRPKLVGKVSILYGSVVL